MKKIIGIFLVMVSIMCLFSVTVSAETSDSFNRIYKEGEEISTVFSRECYNAVKNITGSTLGIENSLEGLNDIYASKNGNVYLLASDVSRIIVLDKNYNLLKELTIVDQQGNEVDIAGAKGIYADEDGTIYVADTTYERVIKLDSNGKILLSLELPDSDIIPEDFYYQPSRIIRDSENYTYVLSDGCYYGALVYSPENVFEGFIGANTVSATALDTIEYIIQTLVSTDEKEAAQVKTLPYSFLDFSVDSDGYIVTCTGSTERQSNGKGQIRKINQAGANILYKTDTNGDASSSSGFNFLEKEVFKKNNIPQTQNIISIDIDANGYIYALDQTYGLIYVFDSDCNLITGFGGGAGSGEQLGLFTKPTSVALHGTSLLVTDLENKSVTVFEITEFGKLLMKADSMYLNGNYDDAAPLWEEILNLDSGNQLAYRGLAMVAYNQGEYKEALSLARKGYDYSVYDMAYQYILTDFIAENFLWIALAVVLVIGSLIYSFVVVKRKKIVLLKNIKVKTAFSATIHPFRAFDEVKNYNRGSVIIASILLLLFFAVSVLKSTASGFLFLEQSLVEYNILYTLAKTVGLVLLWTIANWLVSTLMSGRGKIHEIFIGTMYSLIPLILFTVISVILSWILPLSGVGLIAGLQTVVLIYTFFVLSVAMMQIHEYNFFRFLLTVVISLFAMLFVVFLLFMIVILIQQFYNLIYSVFNEVLYR